MSSLTNLLNMCFHETFETNGMNHNSFAAPGNPFAINSDDDDDDDDEDDHLTNIYTAMFMGVLLSTISERNQLRRREEQRIKRHENSREIKKRKREREEQILKDNDSIIQADNDEGLILPIENFSNILSYLDAEDLMVTCSLVSKSWHRAIGRKGLLREIKLSFIQQRKGLGIKTCSELQQFLFRPIFNKLTSIDLVPFSKALILKLGKNTIKLLKDACPFINKINFGSTKKVGENMQQLVQHFGPQITSLSLDASFDVTPNVFKNICNGFPNIKILNLSNCVNIFPNMTSTIFSKLHKLKHLEVLDLSNGVGNIFKQSNVDEFWQALSETEGLPSLNTLIFSKHSKLTIDGVKSILRCCPKLKYLDIYKCMVEDICSFELPETHVNLEIIIYRNNGP